MTLKEFYEAVNEMTPAQREAMTIFANTCAFMASCANNSQIDIIPTAGGALNMSLDNGPHASIMNTYREIAGVTDGQDDQAKEAVGTQEEQGPDEGQPVH